MVHPSLTTLALLGTERQAVELPAVEGLLGEVLAQLNPADREGTLLGAAAAFALYQQVGRLPITDSQLLPPPAPADSLPRCSRQAGQHLNLMLVGKHRDVLGEWLALATVAERRVPEETLPTLLDLGRTQSGLREALGPVLGERGRWLAAQNPEWDYVLHDEDDLNVWEVGSRSARLALLQRLRRKDPVAARELVSSTWKEDTGDDRAAFLEILESGLSMADEPFLEDALDDRIKEVRRVAADLLARLPQSRLCERMTERVRPWLARQELGGGDLIQRMTERITPWLALERDLSLKVTLPEKCDKGMQRDGIEPKPPRGSRLGEKAWWLLQAIAAVPLSHWQEQGNVSPEALVRAAGRDNEWREVILTGWAQAAQRQGVGAWAESLLRTSFSHSEVFGLDQKELLKVLPAEQREVLALERLQAEPAPIHYEHSALPLLHGCQYQWSSQLTEAVLDSLRQRIKANDNTHGYLLAPDLKKMVLYMNPALVASASQGWPTQSANWSRWSSTVDDILATLQFRHDIRRGMKDEG